MAKLVSCAEGAPAPVPRSTVPIAAIVPAEVWGEAMADMLGEIRQGRVAEGLAVGVRDVGKVLSQHFPRADDDENELPDRLIEV